MARYSEVKPAFELRERWSVKRATLAQEDYRFFATRALEAFAYSGYLDLNPTFSIHYQYSQDIFAKHVRTRGVKDGTRIEFNEIYLDIPGNAFLSSAITHLFWPHLTALVYAKNMLSAAVMGMTPKFDFSDVRFFPPNRSILATGRGEWIQDAFPHFHQQLEKLSDGENLTCYSELRSALAEVYVTEESASRMGSLFRRTPALRNLDPHELACHVDHERILLTVTRFMLGHEFGHFVFNSRNAYRDKIWSVIESALPDRNKKFDVELFADLVAFEYLIINARADCLSSRQLLKDILTGIMLITILDVYNLRGPDASGLRGNLSSLSRYKVLCHQLEASEFDPELTMRYSTWRVWHAALQFWLAFVPAISEMLTVIRDMVPRTANGASKRLLRFDIDIHDRTVFNFKGVPPRIDKV